MLKMAEQGTMDFNSSLNVLSKHRVIDLKNHLKKKKKPHTVFVSDLSPPSVLQLTSQLIYLALGGAEAQAPTKDARGRNSSQEPPKQILPARYDV